MGKPQLSWKERVKIETLLKQKYRGEEIARILDRDPTSIRDEIKRNLAFTGKYDASTAQFLYRRRKRKACHKPWLKTEETKEYVVNHLALGWSPEQIAGRLKLQTKIKPVSYISIYRYIYHQDSDLSRYLTSKRAYPKNRNKYCKKRDHIPNRVSIDQRSDKANLRQERGHWESDTVVSHQSQACLNVVVDRKSRYTIISKITDHTALSTSTALISRLKRLPKSLRKTITYDNGSENSKHVEVNKDLKTKSYFCHPYRSWEKPTVENTNGLIRRFIKKKEDINSFSEAQITWFEALLNHRPRKCLGFKTPFEVLLHSPRGVPP